VDLGANVAEWARDHFQRDHEACWSPALLRDPYCAGAAADGDVRSVKGGHLTSAPIEYAQLRRPYPPDTRSGEIGFRCAYPSGH
jgi:formylglycine-generating enzyme required for sulfatase activity